MARGTGTGTLNFGATFSQVATTTITGLASITAGSHVEAWIMGDSTADHSAYAHQYALGPHITLTCGDVVAATGFTVHAFADIDVRGVVAFHYVWSTP